MKLKNMMIKIVLLPFYIAYILIFLEAIGYPSDIWDKISKWVDNKK